MNSCNSLKLSNLESFIEAAKLVEICSSSASSGYITSYPQWEIIREYSTTSDIFSTADVEVSVYFLLLMAAIQGEI